MSRLALGTAQFGIPYGIANKVGQISNEEAESMLKYAACHGISVIDTAVSYGQSEASLGVIGVRNFKIITKLPPIPNNTNINDVRSWVHGQFSASLRRLRVTKLYGLLLHKPDQLFGHFSVPLIAALQELKEQGLVIKLGVSVYAPEELDCIDSIFEVELVQAPFNLIDRRIYTSGWLKRLQERNVEVHTRSVFLQGLLLMSEDSIPSGFYRWKNLLQIWYKWLDEHNITALQACLTFVLSQSKIDQVVVGADSLKQLQQIIDVTSEKINLELPDLNCDDLNLIDPSRWDK